MESGDYPDGCDGEGDRWDWAGGAMDDSDFFKFTSQFALFWDLGKTHCDLSRKTRSCWIGRVIVWSLSSLYFYLFFIYFSIYGRSVPKIFDPS